MCSHRQPCRMQVAQQHMQQVVKQQSQHKPNNDNAWASIQTSHTTQQRSKGFLPGEELLLWILFAKLTCESSLSSLHLVRQLHLAWVSLLALVPGPFCKREKKSLIQCNVNYPAAQFAHHGFNTCRSHDKADAPLLALARRRSKMRTWPRLIETFILKVSQKLYYAVTLTLLWPEYICNYSLWPLEDSKYGDYYYLYIWELK